MPPLRTLKTQGRAAVDEAFLRGDVLDVGGGSVGIRGCVALLEAAASATSHGAPQLRRAALDHASISFIDATVLAGAAADGSAKAVLAKAEADEDASASSRLRAVLCEQTRLEDLILDGNPDFCDGGCGAVAAALEPSDDNFLVSLQSLSLRRCGVGDVGAVALGAALATRGGHPRLTALNLGGNSIGDAGALALAGAVAARHTKIQTLILSNNKIGIRGAEALALGLAGSLGDAFRATPTALPLRVLALGGNGGIGDVGCTALCFALAAGAGPSARRRIALEDLGLDACGISTSSARPLATLLRSGHLKVLRLARNRLGDGAIPILARVVGEQRGARGLLELDLGHNDVDADGARALAAALLHNDALMKLSLAGNARLGNQKSKNFPAKALAEALRANKTLTELDLSATDIGVDGARMLCEALLQNASLERLHFHGNRAAPAAFQRAFSLRERPNERSRIDHVAKTRGAAVLDDEDDCGGDYAPLEAGQTVSIPVAYGRRTNVVGHLACTTQTTLAEVRRSIDSDLNVSDDRYSFLDGKGKPFPISEEDKRQVLLDVGRELLLLPSDFISLGD
ncbi:hypothetical protein M885DRAFT_198911 [Pelagophyceae sp. CCMP2097]|nr:hypothetical protein M885DRAFT_198911 [Pelagophyceae sp. CCMP2097]